MIQGRVEYLLGARVAALDLDLRQTPVPLVRGLTFDLCELEPVGLCIHVEACVLAAYGRYGYTQGYLRRIVCEGDNTLDAAAGDGLRIVGSGGVALEECYRGYGLLAAQAEIYLVPAPPARETITLDGVVIDLRKRGLVGGVAVALLKVYQKTRSLTGGIGVSVQRHALGGRELDADAVVHRQGVISRAYGLVIVRVV